MCTNGYSSTDLEKDGIPNQASMQLVMIARLTGNIAAAIKSLQRAMFRLTMLVFYVFMEIYDIVSRADTIFAV